MDFATAWTNMLNGILVTRTAWDIAMGVSYCTVRAVNGQQAVVRVFKDGTQQMIHLTSGDLLANDWYIQHNPVTVNYTENNPITGY